MSEGLKFNGLDELNSTLLRIGEKGPHAMARALYREAEDIMGKSKPLVPVETGNLRSTGHVALPAITGHVVSVQLGYGGPAARYALAVHENPRAGATGGRSPAGRKYRRWAQKGQWKYLEQPLAEAKTGMLERLADRVRRDLTNGNA